MNDVGVFERTVSVAAAWRVQREGRTRGLRDGQGWQVVRPVSIIRL